VTRTTAPQTHTTTAGAPDASAAVSVRGLTKRYGDFEAVRGIDLDVKPGETFGFLGPNGAGKSTTIKILCTLVEPSTGSATVAGHDVVRGRDDVRRNIGLVFQDTTLDGYLTAELNLRFHAELYGVPKKVMTDRIRQVMEMVGLWDRRDSLVGTFSGGMKRRLEIARGLLHSPRVLFLDEPTVGLDPQTRSSIWGYIRELREAEEITIFLTTHYMDEAEYCDRIAIIDQGRIQAIGTPDELKAMVGGDVVTVTTADNDGAFAQIAALAGSEPIRDNGSLRVEVPDGAAFVPRLVREAGAEVTSVQFRRPSLDDVFLKLTGRAIREEEAGSKDMMRMMGRAWGGGRRR
jgi:ABC-2 type transport system ATP-binding protein